MLKYVAGRRSNQYDLPRPMTIIHEWVITNDHGYIVVGLSSWPDTDQGRRSCEAVAFALNNAFAEGRRSKRNEILEALEINPCA